MLRRFAACFTCSRGFRSSTLSSAQRYVPPAAPPTAIPQAPPDAALALGLAVARDGRQDAGRQDRATVAVDDGPTARSSLQGGSHSSLKKRERLSALTEGIVP